MSLLKKLFDIYSPKSPKIVLQARW